MRKLTIILIFFSSGALAQADSLMSTADTLKIAIHAELDSIETSFNRQSDSLKQSYGRAKSKIKLLKNSYKQKIDSLRNLKPSKEGPLGNIDSLKSKLTAEKYTYRIDSLNNQLTQTQQKLAIGIDSIKNQVTAKIESLDLPHDAEERISKLSASFDKLGVPLLDEEIGNEIGLNKMNIAHLGQPLPEINADGVPIANTDFQAPAVAMPDKDIQNQLNGVSGKTKGVRQQIQEGISEQKLEETIESKASQLDQVKAIQGQSLTGGLPSTEGATKEQLKELVKKEAVNHFAGKEVALRQGIEKVSKFKEKYRSVSSVKDLPDRMRNPLHDKPFLERFIPGVTLQIESFQYLMLDINASVGYRLTERITAGLGWNQRWAYSMTGGEFIPNSYIYGVRSYGEYTFKKGFSVRADIECMNTEISNVSSSNEIVQRKWVWSVFTGTKQEYKITRSLRGNAQVMYNLFDPHNNSPYINRINFRFGFEFVLKRKV